MIHIVFNEADVYTLNQVLELDQTLEGEVVQIKDDYAVGPLKDIYEPEGIAARLNWWKQVLDGGDGEINDEEPLRVDDEAVFALLVEKLDANENERLWIWCAQNKHDVSGYYWLMSRLKEYQGRVSILYLNNLPFINEKGQIFYPEWLHQIQPSEFLKAKKLERKITLSEFEVDPDEWTKLCNEEKYIRLLEGGKKLTQEDVDFYDADIKSFVTNDFQKVSRLVAVYINKGKHNTGDMFILWRIKEMISQGLIEANGNLGKMKDFEVRKVGASERNEEIIEK